MEKQNKRGRQRNVQPRVPPSSFLSLYPSSSLDQATHPCIPEKFQHRVRRLILPQVLDRGRLWMFPPARLPYLFPHPPGLRGPCSALREEVMAGLLLPPPHHRHLSSPVFRILSLGYGPIAACPDSSWKQRPTTTFLMRRSCFRRRPFPGGGLYALSGQTWSEIHWAAVRGQVSVATLAMCGGLISHLHSSGTTVTLLAPDCCSQEEPFLIHILLGGALSRDTTPAYPVSVYIHYFLSTYTGNK